MTSSRFSSFSLRSRMLAASAVLAALVIGVFVALILAISALQAATKQEARSKEVTASALMLEKLVLDVESAVRGYALTGNQDLLNPYHAAREELPSRLDEFEKLTSREQAQRQPAERLTLVIRQYLDEFAGPLVLFTELGAARSSLAKSENDVRITDIRGRFKRILETEDAIAASRKQSAESKSRHAIQLGVAGLAGTAALMLIFGLYLASSIARPVREAAEGASRFASGELSVRLEQGGPGEVGELTEGFNQMAERLESARAELEEQNAQLRESERLKSDLVNTVSHGCGHLSQACSASRSCSSRQIRLRDATALPRHRRRAGPQALGADRRLSRCSPHRRGEIRTRPGAARHGGLCSARRRSSTARRAPSTGSR